MPTTGKFKGIQVEISTDGGSTFERIGCATELTFNAATDSLEAPTCMEDLDSQTGASCAWKTFDPGDKEWSIDISGLIIYDAVINVSEFRAWHSDCEKVVIRFGTFVSGDPEVSGTVFITSFSETYSTEDFNAYSVTFQGDGAYVETITP